MILWTRNEREVIDQTCLSRGGHQIKKKRARGEGDLNANHLLQTPHGRGGGGL